MNNIIPLCIVLTMMFSMVLIAREAQKKCNNSDDFVVASRSTPLFLLVGTLFATFWGGGTVIGGSGAAFNDGILGVIADPFAAGLSLMLIGLFFVKTLRRLKLKSLGELYEVRYGESVSYLASTLMIPTYIIWTAVQLLAISKILNIVFGLNPVFVILIGAITITLFTFLGGIIAVVWTDTAQMIIILIGLILILIFGINSIGGLKVLMLNTPERFWDFFPVDNSFSSWIAYLSLWIGMGLGNIPSPDLSQRAFIAKDVKTAKHGFLLAGGLYWLVGFVPVLIALIGISMADLKLIDINLIKADSELLIPLMAIKLFNPYLLGIFIGSLVCTVLSSASTSLFTTAILLSNDVIIRQLEKRGKQISSKDEIFYSKLSIIIVIVISILIAVTTSALYDLMIFAFSILFGMLFFPFVFAIKSDFANKYGIMAGMLTGFLINLTGCIVQKTFLPQPEEFFTIVPAMANLLIIVIVSYITRNKSKPMAINKILLEKGE